jgi:golgin subfamily B member 1
MTFAIPELLVERIGRRQSILCAGLGLGRAAGVEFPSWRSLGTRMADWYEAAGKSGDDLQAVRLAAEEGDPLSAVGYAACKLGPEVTADLLRDAFVEPAEAPEVHQILASLPFRGVVTTAWDGLLGKAFGVGRDGGPTAFTPADAATLRQHRGSFLLAAHGDPARPATLIAGTGDLRRVLSAGGDYRAFLEELYGRRSLVLVGYHPADPDFKLLLERHFGNAALGSTPHFLLADGVTPFDAEQLYEAHGLTVVPVDHDLMGFLRALQEQVQAAQSAARPDDDDLVGWLEFLAGDPGNPEALDALNRLEGTLRASGSWDRLLDLLLGRLEHEHEPAQRQQTLRQVASIFEAEVGDLGKAFTALQACLRESPDDVDTILELERLAQAAGLWNDLVAEYAQLIQSMSGAKAAAHWMRLGRWYARELGHREYAISSFKQAIALDANNAEAYAGLAEALQGGERWTELVETLEKQVKLESEPTKQEELWLTLGDIHETRLGQAVQAIEAYLKALAIEPDSTDAMGALERLYRKSERWRDLCELLEKRALMASDASVAAELRHEIGEIKAEKLDDAPGAITVLEGIVADHPRRAVTLRTLITLYAKLSRIPDYLRTLDRLVEAVDTDEERLLVLRRAAAEYDERDVGRAIQCHERVLEIRPEDSEAFQALARLYRRDGRHQDAAGVITRHISATQDAKQRRELWRTLGKLYEEDLADVPAAVDAYENLVGLGGDTEEALAALMRLRQRGGDWGALAETALRRAETESDPKGKAEFVYQAGKIAVEHLNDTETAESRFMKALELDQGHVPSLNGLIEINRGRGDYLRAAKLMAEAVERTQNRLEKDRLLYEAGCLHQDQLEDEAKAEALFARALESDPEHVQAGMRLADIYFRGEAWAKLEPVLDMLVRKADPNDRPLCLDLNSGLAQCCTKLGNDEKAIRAWSAAYAIDPTALPVLQGYASLLFQHGQKAEQPRAWGDDPDRESSRADAAQAVKLYQAMLHHHGDSLARADQLDVYQRLGQLHLKLNENEKALNYFEKTLAIEPDHRLALESAIEILTTRKEWARVIECQRALAAVSNDEEQSRRLEEIGDIYFEHMEDVLEASVAYQAALDVAPKKRSLLSKLLDLYSQQKAWEKAVDIISRLCELEQDQTKRARYHYTAAVLYRDELKNDDEAVANFDKTLDDAPETTKAFDAQEKVLTKKEDWKNLARAYRRMIKRLPAEGLNDLRLRLWQAMGELALGKLGDQDTAIAAFEVAATIDPKNMQRQELLADLYIKAGPDYLDKAIASEQVLLQRAPERLQSYRTLRRLYGDAKQYDKMWCVCGALCFLKKADAEEQKFFDTNKPRGLVPAKRKLTEDLWQRTVMHPDEDRFLAATFARLGPPVAMLRAQPAETFGLKRKDRLEDKDDRPIAKIFRYACQTLDLQGPDLYVKDGQVASVQVANTIDKNMLRPSLVFTGQLSDKLRERETLFDVGKRLAFLRPERFLRYSWPTPPEMETALRGMLLALQVAAPPQSPGTGDPAEVERIARELRRTVPPQVLEPMAAAARKWMAGRDRLDMGAWVAAVDLTASRAGFILCNDFETAARFVSKEGPAQSPLPPKDRLKHLLGYSVSEEYFQVRKHLGIEIEVQK